ncbi:MAG: pyruvate formate-lyase-activating protein [Suipraeoptans sp.]
MKKGYIHSLESFGSVDGPGIRFVIFFAGCPMRCAYCHNPDTWNMNTGTQYTVNELIEKAKRYRSYWGSEGGITVSGGEPLMQIDFLIDLFKEAKTESINTVLDTSGNPFTKQEPFFSKFNILMKYTDLIMLDIKHMDNQEHIKLTGKPNENILEMAEYLSDINKPIWIRHVLVPEITDNYEYLLKLRDLIKSLNNVKKVEVLPYHNMGEFKYEDLGMDYKLKGINPPDESRIENANKILHS